MVTGDVSISLPNVTVHRYHPKGFFSMFDRYLYVHDGEYFDPRPRLFHECVHYGKEISYCNALGVMDGSWYRYNDAVRGLSDRCLTEDDVVIKELLR